MGSAEHQAPSKALQWIYAVYSKYTLRKKIKRKLRAIKRIKMEDVLSRAVGVAFVIIEHYLGQAFSEKYIKLSNSPDQFMRNGFADDWSDRIEYQDRVCHLADFLFSLRNIEGFDVLVTRFITRDCRSVYFEAMAANLFQREDFRIAIQRERGSRGEDFDFMATRGRDTIAVEVTGCTNERYSESNLRNVLNNKRKQLPSTGPAALFCVLPVSWLKNFSGDLGAEAERVTVNFFETSS